MELAVARLTTRLGSAEFSLQELIAQELQRIVNETGSRGATPQATLRRELQQLRDLGKIEFLGRGQYRLAAAPLFLPSAFPSKCVFVIGPRSTNADQPDTFYRLDEQWLMAAARAIGQWIVYQESGRGYCAIARVEQIVRDPQNQGVYLALLEPGSYLEFGRDVALSVEGKGVERRLFDQNGGFNERLSIQPVRPISDDDFNRILGFGLVDAEDLLPSDDRPGDNTNKCRENAADWGAPVDRATALVSRTLRDRQFRKRILEVYDRRCALTGFQFIDDCGRAEAQAAHIMSVEAGGPDRVANGIALSGTVHWMFDRGLISLGDDGKILLSRKLNDAESAKRLLHSDGRARLPEQETHRPNPRFLAWHREYHGLFG